jgi:DNA repair protein RadA/Sms
MGEVGLLGELRPVSGLDRRLREAARLGFERAIVPAGRLASSAAVPGLRIVQVANLGEALVATLGAGKVGPAGPGSAKRERAVTVVTVEPGTRVLG